MIIRYPPFYIRYSNGHFSQLFGCYCTSHYGCLSSRWILICSGKNAKRKSFCLELNALHPLKREGENPSPTVVRCTCFRSAKAHLHACSCLESCWKRTEGQTGRPKTNEGIFLVEVHCMIVIGSFMIFDWAPIEPQSCQLQVGKIEICFSHSQHHWLQATQGTPRAPFCCWVAQHT